jgi:hypothetical protein
LPCFLDRCVGCLERTFDELGVLVERRQGAIEDVVGVLKPNLKLRPRIHVLDVDIDLVDRHLDACNQIEEVRHLSA